MGTKQNRRLDNRIKNSNTKCIMFRAPVSFVAWEAEIRKITVQGQPGKNV
jgi:hypothetical protein